MVYSVYRHPLLSGIRDARGEEAGKGALDELCGGQQQEKSGACSRASLQGEVETQRFDYFF